MQNIAVFEAEPDAEAMATVLRENGYDAEVITKGDGDYDKRMRDFFQGRVHEFHQHALVLSDADEDTFMRSVQRHYGTAIKGTI